MKEEATESRNETKPSIFIQTRYAYPSTTKLRTRKIAQGFGAQKLTRRAQATHGSKYSRFGHLQLGLYASCSIGPETGGFASHAKAFVGRYCRDVPCGEMKFARPLKVNREEGKTLLTSTLYGGQVPEHLKTNAFLADLSKVSIYLRWLAISLLEDEFHRFSLFGSKQEKP